MKFRCTHNSIRLRLRKTNIATLIDENKVTESVCLWSLAELSVTLAIADIPKLKAKNDNGRIVIIMPETTIEGAMLATNNIREKIEKMKFSYLKEGKKITISFGLVDFRIGVNIETLFDRADKALYQAKAHGRNRVEAAK